MLGEVGTFTKGAPLSKADISEEGTPFILYGELYTTYNEVTNAIVRKTDKAADLSQYSRIGDVIIPTSGETPEEIATATCVMLPNVILAGDLNIFRGTKVDGRIISYIVNHVINRDISRIAQGKSVVHVKADELSKIRINYPNSEEQKKLIRFLEILSGRIEKQRQLVELLKSYKRGFLNSYISQNEQDWSKVRLSDILTERKEYCEKDGTYPHATLSKDGVYGKTDRYDRDYLVTSDDKKYKVTHKGDLCYNPANLKFGVICINTYGDAIFSPIYVTFEISEQHNTEFVGAYLMRSDFINQALRFQEGTVYERMAVSPDDLLAMQIHLPPKEKQDKLADVLSKMQMKIQAEEDVLNKTALLKKVLLSLLFI